MDELAFNMGHHPTAIGRKAIKVRKKSLKGDLNEAQLIPTKEKIASVTNEQEAGPGENRACLGP